MELKKPASTWVLLLASLSFIGCASTGPVARSTDDTQARKVERRLQKYEHLVPQASRNR